MTTWDEPCYTTDFIGKLATLLPSDDEYAKLIWDRFGVEIQTLEGTELRDKYEMHTYRGFKKLFPRTGFNKDEYMIRTIIKIHAKCKNNYTGLAACFRLLKHVDKMSLRPSVKSAQRNEYVREMDLVSLLCSLQTGRIARKTIAQFDLKYDIQKKYNQLMDAAYEMNHLAYFWRARSHVWQQDRARKNDQLLPEIDHNSMSFGKNFSLWSYPGIAIVHVIGIDEESSETLYFDPRSIRRVCQLLRSLAKSYSYFTVTARMANDAYYESTIPKFFDEFMESLYATKRANEVARAWDVLMYMSIAKEANDVWDRAEKDQYDKFIDNKYYQIIDDRVIMNMLTPIPFALRIELLKLYKILPCPDFDPFTGFLKMREYHMNPNEYCVMPSKFEDLKLTVSKQEFEDFRKLQYARRFYSRHGFCPGVPNVDILVLADQSPNDVLVRYPHISIKELKLHHMQFIDISGSAFYQDRNNMKPEIFTDKGCAPNDYDLMKIANSYDLNQLPLDQRSYLIWYLSQTDIPLSIRLRFLQTIKSSRKQQTAHFKPESKKPEPRNFYSNTPYGRLIAAEYEENVTNYLSHDKNSWAGKDPEESAIALKHILFTNSERDRWRVINVSFDIEKWSPKYARGAKEESMRIWIEAFGQPLGDEWLNMFRDIDLHFIHEGIHQTYRPPLVDLEGQSGKTNTAFHIDIMAYAVRQIKQLNLFEGSGRLAVLIDDGLLGLAYPKDVSNEQIVKTMNVIEAVYAFVGFKISWDKTFVSSKIAMFLNEIYYDGVQVATGFKAFLKLQTTKVEDELSIAGKLKALSAMARGCVKAGVDPDYAMHELNMEVYTLLSRSFGKKQRMREFSPTQLMLFCITPIALGGLGLPIASQLTMSPNVDPVMSFNGLCKYLIHIQPAFRLSITEILKQTFRERNDLEILRNPDSVRIEERVLTESKHIRYIIDAIRGRAANKMIRPLLAIDMNATATDILDSLPKDAYASEITCAYNMSPIHELDTFMAKFKRASTFMQLVSPRTKRMLIGRYITEAIHVSKRFQRLFSF